jgi:hypothetical protein
MAGPHAQAVALLVGDIEAAQEASGCWQPASAPVKADVLLVPHHGSKTSSSPAFLDAVQPRTGVGAGGLPQPVWPPCGTEVLAALPTNARIARGGVGALRRGDLVFRPSGCGGVCHATRRRGATGSTRVP